MNIAHSDSEPCVELTGPDTVAGRFLRSFWQPIFLASELRPGQVRPVRIMGESLTLYRGGSGRAYLTQFRCPHRGTQLSTGWVEGDALRCRYHGWKFAGEGQCIEQPGGRNGVGFADKVRIRSYPVAEYLGLVFAFLGEGTPPDLPRYTQFDGEGVLVPMRYQRDCNYFQNMENSVDEMHIPFVHRSSVFANARLTEELPVVEAQATEYGFVQTGRRPGDRSRKQHFIMPNILLAKVPPESPAEVEWRDYISWRVPIDDVSHMSFLVQRLTLAPGHSASEVASLVAKDSSETMRIATSILAGEASLDDFEDYRDLLNLQDLVVQLGQGTVANRSSERLTKSDAPLILLRKLWQHELTAMMRSEPRTIWRLTDELVAAPGD
jgi:5,5'-dehydrodivanillate O-demethylase oxygenase subunit